MKTQFLIGKNWLKMVDSFVQIPHEECLKAGTKDRIYLIEYPRNVNLAELQGVQIPLQSKWFQKEVQGKPLGFSLQPVSHEKRFRTVLSSGGISTSEFSGVLKVSPNLMSRSSNLKDNFAELLLPDQAYQASAQITDMKVNTVPIGSLSSVSDILSRKLTGPVSSRQSHVLKGSSKVKEEKVKSREKDVEKDKKKKRKREE